MMGGKKNRERFSIKFNENDPSHDAVIRLLEKQGPHSKAQFLVNAVLHYINCPESPDIALPRPVDKAAIEEIVAEILKRQENENTTEVVQRADVREGYRMEREIVKADKNEDEGRLYNEMNQATFALIADTMSAFRSS